MNTPSQDSDSAPSHAATATRPGRSGGRQSHDAAALIEAARKGNFGKIGDFPFTHAELLPPAEAGTEGGEHGGAPTHFLKVAKENDHLEAVPGAVWVGLLKLQNESLSDSERLLLGELMAFYNELVALYCQRLTERPGIYHSEIPPDFRNDPAIRALHRKHELQDLEKSPVPFEQLPQRFQQGEDAFHSWSRPWIKLLASDTHPFDKIPDRLKKSAEALEAWRQPWIQRLASAPIDSYLIPPELRQNQEAIDTRKRYHCEAVRQGDETALRNVPKELRETPELREAMTEGWSVWLAQHGIKNWSVLPESFRLTERLQQQAAQLWIERLHSNPFSWTEVPKELRGHESISDAWMAAQPLPPQMEPSFAEIAAQPNLTPVTLQLWRNSNHWNRQKTGTMLVDLRGKPWLFDKLNDAARKHPMILEAALEGCKDLLGRNAGYFHVLPRQFRSDEAVLDAAAAEWLDDLKFQRCTWEQIPASLHSAPSLNRWKRKEDSRLRKTAREQKQAVAEGRLRSNPHLRDDELTQKELKSASIRKLRTSYWTKKVEQDRMLFLEVPESLLDQASIQTAMRAHWGPIVHRNPAEFDQLPERVKADEGIQRVYKIATRSASPEAGS